MSPDAPREFLPERSQEEGGPPAPGSEPILQEGACDRLAPGTALSFKRAGEGGKLHAVLEDETQSRPVSSQGGKTEQDCSRLSVPDNCCRYIAPGRLCQLERFSRSFPDSAAPGGAATGAP